MPYCSECGNEMSKSARFCESCGHQPGRERPRLTALTRYILPIAAVVLIVAGMLLAARARERSWTPPEEGELHKQLAEAERLANDWRRIPIESPLWADDPGSPDASLVIKDQFDGSAEAAVRDFVHAVVTGSSTGAAELLTMGHVDPHAARGLDGALTNTLRGGDGPLSYASEAIYNIAETLQEAGWAEEEELQRLPDLGLHADITVEQHWDTKATVTVTLGWGVEADAFVKWASELTHDEPDALDIAREAVERGEAPEKLRGWRWFLEEQWTERLHLVKADDGWLIVSPQIEAGEEEFLNQVAFLFSNSDAARRHIHGAFDARPQVKSRPELDLSSCLSNMKQLALGAMMYAQDYDERFPPDWGRLKAEDVLYPYIMNSRIYECPADLVPSSPSYAAWPELSGRFLGRISRPAETPLAFEVRPDGSTVDWRHLGGSGGGWCANWAYADGHCNTQPEGYWPRY